MSVLVRIMDHFIAFVLFSYSERKQMWDASMVANHLIIRTRSKQPRCVIYSEIHSIYCV